MLTFFFLLKSTFCKIEQIPKQGYPTTYIQGTTLILSNDSIYTFGGFKDFKLSSTLKSFNLSSKTWSEISVSSQDLPEERTDSSGFEYNQNLYILGGKSQNSILNDFWQFNLVTLTWKQIFQSGHIPTPRLKPIYCVFNQSLYLFGGEVVKDFDSKFYKLGLDNFEWSVEVDDELLGKVKEGFLFGVNESLYFFDKGSVRLSQVDLELKRVVDLGVDADIGVGFQCFAVYDNYIYLVPEISYLGTVKLYCLVINLVTLTIQQISCEINGTFSYSTQSQETLYLFGEQTSNGISNSLISIDLSSLQSEILSHEFIYPRARAYHSLVRCRKDLWLYGGCSYNEFFSDSWKFDSITETWEIIKKSKGSPQGRCGHRVLSLYGDSFVVFGGTNAEGFLKDLYIYNFLSNTWKFIGQDQNMPGRAGSCLALNYPYIYVQGGRSTEGVLSDLWKMSLLDSSFNEVKITGSTPSLYDHICKFIYVSRYGNIMLSTGKNSNERMNENIYLIDIHDKSSKIIASNPDYAVSCTKLIDMENFEMLIGGFKGYDATNEIILFRYSGSQRKIILPVSIAGHDAVHIGVRPYNT